MPHKGRLAICFLAVRDVENIDLWRSWYSGHEDQVSLYVHTSPGKKRNIKDKDLRAALVKDAVPTAWGDISLVKAEGVLYRNALKDQRNTFFLLASETCIPVVSFPQVMARLCKSRTKGIMDVRIESMSLCEGISESTPDSSLSCHSSCVAKMRGLGVIGPRSGFYHAPQWKVLSRRNAKDFVSMCFDKKNAAWVKAFTECQVVVKEHVAADETMFINYLVSKYGGYRKAGIRKGLVTAAHFVSVVHPVTYKGRTKGTCAIQEACDTGALFARKFKRLQDQTFHPPVCTLKKKKC